MSSRKVLRSKRLSSLPRMKVNSCPLLHTSHTYRTSSRYHLTPKPRPRAAAIPPRVYCTYAKEEDSNLSIMVVVIVVMSLSCAKIGTVVIVRYVGSMYLAALALPSRRSHAPTLQRSTPICPSRSWCGCGRSMRVNGWMDG